MTFYLSFLTNPFLQFPSILGDVKYVILIGGLDRHIEDKAHFICGSGRELVCSPLAELYQRWMTTILSALVMIIKFHWWPSISFSKEHTYSNTDLFEEWFDKQSREGCVSTVHLLSRWKFSFVHSLGDGEFELNALDELGRWFLAFDNTRMMVTKPCKWLGDMVFCTFWYFRCSTVYLSILFDGSVSWTQQSVVQAGGGCISVWRYWFYCIVHASCTWFFDIH